MKAVILLLALASTASAQQFFEGEMVEWRYAFDWPVYAQRDNGNDTTVTVPSREAFRFRFRKLKPGEVEGTRRIDGNRYKIVFKRPPHVADIASLISPVYDDIRDREIDALIAIHGLPEDARRESLLTVRHLAAMKPLEDAAAEEAKIKAGKKQAELEAKMKEWAPEIQAAIKAKELRIGMDLDQTKAAWGEPSDFRRTTTAEGEFWSVEFHNRSARFHNGSLTSFSD